MNSFKILTWLKFLFLGNNSALSVRIKFISKKQRIFGYSKAPMAHKTRSQEFYLLKMYSFLIFIKMPYKPKNMLLSDLFFFIKFAKKAPNPSLLNLLETKYVLTPISVKLNNFYTYPL